MILKKITVKDFFRFYGTQYINVSIDSDKNVTVIRGENGTGKTTILNAFYWCFYGDVSDPLSVDRMLNDMTAAKLNDGDKEEVFVEVIFEDKGVDYTINRRQNYMKKDGKIVLKGEPELDVFYSNSIGNIQNISDPESFFPSIIPKNLRGFFFFDGERIDRLAKIDGKEEIQQAILDILGLTNLDNTQEDLQKVKGEYNKQIKDYIKGSDAELSDKYTSLLSEKENIDGYIKDFKSKLSQARDNYESVNSQLAEHNIEVVRKNQEERKELEKEIEKINEKQEELKKGHLEYIAKNFKLYGIRSGFDQLKELLEEKRAKGELPSDIKVQFVDDLLERGRCICTTDLVEGTPEYEAVNELKKTAGRTELDDAYTRLTSFINYDEGSNFYKEFYVYIKNIEDLQSDKETKENRLKKIRKDLKYYPEEKIRELEDLREELKQDISYFTKQIGKYEHLDANCSAEINKVEEEIRKLKLNNSQAERIRKCMDVVSNLEKINKEIRDYFVVTTREDLDKKLKTVFASLATKDYRMPILTEDFELNIRSSKSNEREEILSRGEGQISSLAFIGSLVSYSREKEESALLSDFGGGDFPIVMDSPFGNLDSEHTANVAKGINKLAKQVIIIVSDRQWRKEVEDNISDSLIRMYILEDGNFDINLNEGEYTQVKELRC